jgi:hypothetical protein
LRKGPRDGDSTLFATAKLFHTPSGQAGEVTPGERLLDCGPILAPLFHPPALVRRATHSYHVAHSEAQGDHLALWYEGDETREEPAVEPAHVSAHHAYRPFGWVQEPRGNPQQRRFARSVRAK